MQAPTSRQSYRGVQRNPRPGTAAFMQGKKQAALSIQRYHILCAALQRKYEVRDIIMPTTYHRPDEESDDEDLSIMYRATIDFSAYKDFKLHPLKDVELPKPDDGGYSNLMSLCMYPLTISDDWRMREGGVLCALAEYGDFFNCILVYHNGRGKSTTIDEWDTLFRKLQNSEYRKNLIPCMFFGQIDGCLDRNCPFLHDREAVLATRAEILEGRRSRFSSYKHSPTWRQHCSRYHAVLDCISGGDEALRTKLQDSRQVDEGMTGDRAYCANPRCMKPWKDGQARKPLKACKRCKFTMYCSPECQKQDWPRHKKDPCAPIEEIIENDELWNPLGARKGTGFFKTQRDIQTRTMHLDA